MNPSNRTIYYDLRFTAHGQNLVDVEVTLPEAAGTQAAGQGPFTIEVSMPVWTPGSYIVREFARHVQDVAAHDVAGAALEVCKANKHTWRITAPAPTAVRLSYRVWGRELTVRSNCIEQDFALLQGAATYLSPVVAAAWPHTVRVHLPPAYPTVVCGLEVAHAQGVSTVEAENFDVLVDTPLALGKPDLQHFDIDGIRHTLATFGGEGLFDGARAAQDFAKIARCTKDMFGVVPYERYVMINMLFGGQGGLEHRHSAVIMAGPYVMRSAATYRAFLGLVAHEHFHAWNIKRLRPKALGPFDYTQENHTHSLWVAEGITAFYDNLTVLRAGCTDAKSYLSALAADWARLMATPGRHKQTLAEASFDAWIKFYRRDENTDNTAVSYYLKGAIVAMLLNAELLHRSHNKVCLDDVMRLAYGRYSAAHGFEEAQFRACAQQVCPDLPDNFLHLAVDSTDALRLDTFCTAFGVTVGDDAVKGPDGSGPDGTDAKIELGVQVKESDGRLLIAQVTAGGAAHEAALQADDEILAIDGQRMNGTALSHLLALRPAGAALSVLVSRYGTLRTVTVVGRVAEAKFHHFAWLPQASSAQTAARTRWLGAAACEGLTKATQKG